MDVELVQTLRATPFSPARRLFVLEEMLARTPEPAEAELPDRLRRLIELDRANVRRETGARAAPADGRPLGCLVDSPAPGDDPHRRAHREFVTLVDGIVRGHFPAAPPSVIDPVRRQVERLQRVDTPGSRCHWDEEQSSGSGFPRPCS